MILTQEIRSAHARTAQKVVSSSVRVSVADYVEAAMELAGYPVDRTASGRAHRMSSEISESCRESPNGMWMPLLIGRDLNVSSPAAGGNLAVESNTGTLVSALRPLSAVIAAGATVLTGLRGTAVNLPVVGSGVSAQWVDEGVSPSNPDPTFGKAILRPRTITATLAFTRRLLKNAALRDGIEIALRDELIASILSEVDRAVLAGSGIAPEPAGLLNLPDMPTIEAGANGASPSLEVLSTIERTQSENSGLEASAWFGNSALRDKLRRTRRAADLDFLIPAESSSLFGRPFVASEHIPGDLSKGTGTGLSALILGHFPSVVIGFWGPAAIDVVVDPYTLARQGMIKITASAEIGIVATQPAAFVRCLDFVTT